MTAEVAALPEVRAVQTIRQTRVALGQANVMLIALELGRVGETTRVRITAGDRSTMFREAAAGLGVVVSDNLAQLQRLAVGDELTLAAPRGVLRLPIVGAIVDYSDQQGAVLVDRQLFERYWGDDSVNFYRVYLADGADAAAAKRRILEQYAGRRRVFVLDNGELRDYIFGIATSWFALTYLQVAIAMVIAVLGIMNVLTVSITDRRRELGVLRAVGALGAQVRRTIWLEALGTAAVGLVLGLALGALALVFALEAVRLDVAGMRLEFRYPFAVAAATVPTLLAAAFFGAVGPARAATRSSLVEALEYE
jgi:putative ABC transport system permease protein